MSQFRAIELSPVPLYTQVRESLRERITDGTYQPHAQLPAESDLSKIFGVSRITVRQALGDLQKEGMIFKVSGKGTFVAKPKAFQQLTQLEGFAEAMTRMGHSIRNDVISHKILPAGVTIAQRLHIDTRSLVSEIKRVRYLNGQPVSLEVTYVSQPLGERLLQEDLSGRDIFAILENDYGIALGHADLQVDAVLADAALSHLLHADEGAALLRIERLTHADNGTPLDFEYLYFRGDAFQYRLRIERRSNP